MPYRIETYSQGLKVFYTGTVTLETIEQCDRQIVTDSAFFDVLYTIYNFLGTDELSISVSEAYLLGLRSAEKASRNSSLKFAVVSKNPEVFVLTESFKRIAELSDCSWQVKVFSSMHEAEAWCEAVSDVSVSHG